MHYSAQRLFKEFLLKNHIFDNAFQTETKVFVFPEIFIETSFLTLEYETQTVQNCSYEHDVRHYK